MLLFSVICCSFVQIIISNCALIITFYYILHVGFIFLLLPHLLTALKSEKIQNRMNQPTNNLKLAQKWVRLVCTGSFNSHCIKYYLPFFVVFKKHTKILIELFCVFCIIITWICVKGYASALHTTLYGERDTNLFHCV